MPAYRFNNQQFDRACHNLSRFVIHRAHKTARRLGFGYVESAHAPATYYELEETFEFCSKTRSAFPVWRGASDGTIYTSREANWAFRYWHDMIHAIMKKPLDVLGEMDVGTIQWKETQEEFGVGSPESWLIYGDTIGQTLYYQRHQDFPTDQRDFVKHFVSFPEQTLAHRY